MYEKMSIYVSGMEEGMMRANLSRCASMYRVTIIQSNTGWKRKKHPLLPTFQD